MDKELELEVKKFTASELAKGESLSNIQNGINARFHLSMTYMEVRILASTLDVDWQALDPNAAKKAAAPVEELSAPPPAEPETAADETVPAADEGGTTVVEVSKLARPGMMLSGTVKFASGSTADWYVDSMGRLGLENLVGAKPTPEDVEKFQIELDKAVRKAMGR